MSSRMANKPQQAALVAVFTPSGHATRLVIAPGDMGIQLRRERIIMNDILTVCDSERKCDGEHRNELFEGHC